MILEEYPKDIESYLAAVILRHTIYTTSRCFFIKSNVTLIIFYIGTISYTFVVIIKLNYIIFSSMKSQIASLDFVDTFLDMDHLRTSFPQYAIKVRYYSFMRPTKTH